MRKRIITPKHTNWLSGADTSSLSLRASICPAIPLLEFSFTTFESSWMYRLSSPLIRRSYFDWSRVLWINSEVKRWARFHAVVCRVPTPSEHPLGKVSIGSILGHWKRFLPGINVVWSTRMVACLGQCRAYVTASETLLPPPKRREDR